jgi:hypothetical protein
MELLPLRFGNTKRREDNHGAECDLPQNFPKQHVSCPVCRPQLLFRGWVEVNSQGETRSVPPRGLRLTTRSRRFSRIGLNHPSDPKDVFCSLFLG